MLATTTTIASVQFVSELHCPLDLGARLSRAAARLHEVITTLPPAPTLALDWAQFRGAPLLCYTRTSYSRCRITTRRSRLYDAFCDDAIDDVQPRRRYPTTFSYDVTTLYEFASCSLLAAARSDGIPNYHAANLVSNWTQFLVTFITSTSQLTFRLAFSTSPRTQPRLQPRSLLAVCIDSVACH